MRIVHSEAFHRVDFDICKYFSRALIHYPRVPSNEKYDLDAKSDEMQAVVDFV